MEFDKKHVMYALVIAVLFAVLAWLFVNVIKIDWLWTVLKIALVYGGLAFAFRGVKGVGNAIMVGIVYIVVFLVVAILVMLIKWPGAAIYPLNVLTTFKDMFVAWPGIWVPTIAHLLFFAVLGWANEQK